MPGDLATALVKVEPSELATPLPPLALPWVWMAHRTLVRAKALQRLSRSGREVIAKRLACPRVAPPCSQVDRCFLALLLPPSWAAAAWNWSSQGRRCRARCQPSHLRHRSPLADAPLRNQWSRSGQLKDVRKAQRCWHAARLIRSRQAGCQLTQLRKRSLQPQAEPCITATRSRHSMQCLRARSTFRFLKP